MGEVLTLKGKNIILGSTMVREMRLTNDTVPEEPFYLMETFTKENINVARNMVKELINSKMEHDTLEYILKIKKDGKGTFYYPDGSIYEGQWTDDRKHGQGTYTYPNGDTYEGNWTHDLRNGTGTYTYASSGSRYIGQWVNGKADGPGELVHSNHRYQGACVDGSIQGAGKYIFELGCEQHGEYIPVEMPGDPEDDEAGSTTIPKWKAVKVTSITLPK